MPLRFVVRFSRFPLLDNRPTNNYAQYRMSTVATNSKPTSNSTAASAANAASAVVSMASAWYLHPAFKVVAGMIGIILYVLSFYFVSNFVGNKDSWKSLEGTVWKTFGLSMGGSLLLFAVACLFFIQDQSYVIYVVLLMSFLTFGMAYSAIALSAITK